MNKTIYLFAFMLIVNLSKAQVACNTNVLSGSQVFSVPDTITNAVDGWICNGGSVRAISSVFGWYVIESGGSLTILAGSDNMVCVNAGGSVTIGPNAGANNTVRVEAGGTATIQNSYTFIDRQVGAIIYNPGGSPVSGCSQWSVDYSNAPANGCLATAVQDLNNKFTFGYTYLSTVELLTLQTDLQEIHSVSIVDVTGNRITEKTNLLESETALDLSGFGSGLYIIQLATFDGRFATKKFLKHN